MENRFYAARNLISLQFYLGFATKSANTVFNTLESAGKIFTDITKNISSLDLPPQILSKLKGFNYEYAARANIKGKYIRAWNHHDYTIIDCLMNLPLLYWASHEVKDDRYKHIAMMHVDSAIKHHVREDGSIVHIASHNPLKDEVIETLAGQGFAVGSCWTRGQAWAVYGFTLNYIHTNEQRYLDTAIKVADYFINQAKKYNYKVPIDFCQPTEPAYLDNSATVCAVCGMIELYKITGDEKYRDEAIVLLQHLEEDCDFTNENHSIVQKCSEAYYGRQHLPLIYADFFLVEAILKLRDSDFLIW